MKGKFLLAGVIVGSFVLYLSGCGKENAEQSGGGAGCDTTNVSYSRQILPIVEQNCYVCHQGPGASSGIDFSKYSALHGWAQSGFLVGDVTHAGDPGDPFTPMPYGLPMLPECEVNIIVAWVHQGSPNN
jgi:hypothetical protein